MQYESKYGAQLSGDGKSLRNAEPLTHGAGGDGDARQNGTGMAVQNAFVRSRIAQHAAIEIPEFGINRTAAADDGAERDAVTTNFFKAP